MSFSLNSFQNQGLEKQDNNAMQLLNKNEGRLRQQRFMIIKESLERLS